MQKININEVILDYNLYPRMQIDSFHVSHMLDSLEANVELPPIIIDKNSKKVIDGFHRVDAFRRFYKKEKTKGKLLIPAILKTYQTEAEMFIDAMKYNSSHGRMLTEYDRAHCIILAENLNISVDITSEALTITCKKYDELKACHLGELKHSPHLINKKGNKTAKYKTELIPLKNTIRHKAGTELTEKQVETNKKLQGMEQSFYVNQIISLIESDLLNTENEYLMKRLEILNELLENVLAKV